LFKALSQKLDWFLLSNDNFLDSIIDQICSNIDNQRTSFKGVSEEIKKKERRACNVIINALYQGYFSIPETWISIPLGSSYYSGKAYSYRSIKKIYDFLKRKNFIKVKLGSEYARQYTRIFPVKKLKTKFKNLGPRWRHYHYNNNYNPIVLRDNKLIGGIKKKINIPTPNTPKINKYKINLNKINRFLLKHCIALDLEDISLNTIAHIHKRQEDKQSINFSNVSLRRIFSRGSMLLGGRFYGGWWQPLPSKFRPHITIDGKKTSEVDFSTMSLKILYAKENIQIPDNRDLYDIGLRGSKSYLSESRKLIKIYINAILNDDRGNFRLDNKQLNTLKLTNNQLKEKVYNTHKDISKYFFTDIGLKTMFIDSQIAEKVLLHFLGQEVVVLPVHDSFIINSEYVNDLKEAMISLFKSVVGSGTKVKTKGPLTSINFIDDTKLLKIAKKINKKQTLKQREDLIFNDKYPSSIYERYLSSWYKWSIKYDNNLLY
jgi:hypothetical protein